MIPGPFLDRNFHRRRAGLAAYEPGDPGPIPTEPQLREPRMPWDSPPSDVARTLLALLSHRQYADKHRASVGPLLTWALVIFLAGLLIGAVLGGMGSTAIRNAVEPSPARAVHGQTARDSRPSSGERPEPVRVVSSTVTVDVLPASAADTSGSTTHQSEALAPQSSAVPDRGDLTPAASTRARPTSRAFARANEQVIRAAASEFGVDADAHVALAMCESSLNVLAIGLAGEIGAFQFKPATFAWFARDSGLRYDLRDIGDPVAQARVSAWAVSSGYGSHWTCWR